MSIAVGFPLVLRWMLSRESDREVIRVFLRVVGGLLLPFPHHMMKQDPSYQQSPTALCPFDLNSPEAPRGAPWSGSKASGDAEAHRLL